MELVWGAQGIAAVSAVILLAAAGTLGMAGIALVILLCRGSLYAARWVAAGAAVTAGVYVAALAGVSLFGEPRTAEPAGPNDHCGVEARP